MHLEGLFGRPKGFTKRLGTDLEDPRGRYARSDGQFYGGGRFFWSTKGVQEAARKRPRGPMGQFWDTASFGKVCRGLSAMKTVFLSQLQVFFLLSFFGDVFQNRRKTLGKSVIFL